MLWRCGQEQTVSVSTVWHVTSHRSVRYISCSPATVSRFECFPSVTDWRANRQAVQHGQNAELDYATFLSEYDTRLNIFAHAVDILDCNP
jgi:hypothetical protein